MNLKKKIRNPNSLDEIHCIKKQRCKRLKKFNVVWKCLFQIIRSSLKLKLKRVSSDERFLEHQSLVNSNKKF